MELCCTFTDSVCKVLQEVVVEKFSKVIQHEGKAWFGVALTHHVVELLLVGLTA